MDENVKKPSEEAEDEEDEIEVEDDDEMGEEEEVEDLNELDDDENDTGDVEDNDVDDDLEDKNENLSVYSGADSDLNDKNDSDSDSGNSLNIRSGRSNKTGRLICHDQDHEGVNLDLEKHKDINKFIQDSKLNQNQNDPEQDLGLQIELKKSKPKNKTTFVKTNITKSNVPDDDSNHQENKLDYQSEEIPNVVVTSTTYARSYSKTPHVCLNKKKLKKNKIRF